MLQRRGRLAEAETIYRSVLERKERLYGGGDHPSVAATLNNLGVVRRRQHDLPARAGALPARAEVILEATSSTGLTRCSRRRAETWKSSRARKKRTAEVRQVFEPPRTRKGADAMSEDREQPRRDDDVHAHGLVANVNETTAEDDVEAHGLGRQRQRGRG